MKYVLSETDIKDAAEIAHDVFMGVGDHYVDQAIDYMKELLLAKSKDKTQARKDLNESFSELVNQWSDPFDDEDGGDKTWSSYVSQSLRNLDKAISNLEK